jgi:hypothetical protein
MRKITKRVRTYTDPPQSPVWTFDDGPQIAEHSMYADSEIYLAESDYDWHEMFYGRYTIAL